jgi:hypothetical protein
LGKDLIRSQTCWTVTAVGFVFAVAGGLIVPRKAYAAPIDPLVVVDPAGDVQPRRVDLGADGVY